MKVSVVIPVYNEAPTLAQALQRVLAAPVDDQLELIAVDDASSDASPDILARLAQAEPRLKVLRHQANQGKGAALRTGFAAATGDVLLVQDADLEYDPADYPRLLAPIREGRADVVIGSRFLADGRPAASSVGHGRRSADFLHRAANRSLTRLSNLMSGLRLTDMEAGYKLFRREVAQGIRIKSDRFGVEPELVQKVARGKWRVCEVPIAYDGRTRAEGKKITWWDGVKAVWCIVRFRLAD